MLTKHNHYDNIDSIMTQKQKTTTTKTTKTTKVAKVAKAVKQSVTKQELESQLAKSERQLAKDKVMLAQAEQRIVDATMGEDVRNAILIVSLLINLIFLITWVMLQVTTQYDYAISALIFGR